MTRGSAPGVVAPRSPAALVGPAVALAVALLVGLAGCGAPSGTDGDGPTAVRAAPSDPTSARPSPTAPVSTPTPTGPTTMPRSTPVRVEIPAIEVDSDLMELGLEPDGALEVPPTGFPAGWYTGAPTPGELGPAIIAGHVDWRGPGVFHELHRLVPDDEVTVTRADGSVAVFRVTRVGQYPKSAFPTDEVYGDIDHAGLRLITCGGVLNRETGSHDDNIVVFAELVGPR